MSGNKQFVKTRACLSFIRRNRYTYGKISLVPSGERIRIYAASNPATVVAKAGKFPSFLRKSFNEDPEFFLHVFGRAPGGP